jgi:hypothetical protein
MAPKKPRKQTRSGKKLDKTTGKILRPSVKRDASGKAVGLTPEEKRAQVVTNLPEAGREVMQPKENAQTSFAPGTLRKGGMRGSKGAQGGSYPVIQKAVHAALHHLNQAHFAKGAGLPSDSHLETFDAIHTNIKSMDKQLHQSLGTARYLIDKGNGENTHDLTQTQINITRRLNELREHHEGNIQRAMAGREKNGS